MLFFLFFSVATKNFKITFACIISLLDNDELERQDLGSIQLRELDLEIQLDFDSVLLQISNNPNICKYFI